MTPRLTFPCFVLFLSVSTISGQEQAPAFKVPATGTAVLTQSLVASGAAANRVQDLIATGTMTYFWAGQPVQATATIRARGAEQFRLDSNLAGGTRSIAFGHNSGARKDESGKLTQVPLHNAISLAETCFPYLAFASALTDPAFSVSYIGLVKSGNQTLNQIRIKKIVPPAQDPKGIIRKLSQTDYFIDPQTNLVVKIADVTHPVETFTREYPREVELLSYTPISGVAVPTLVREKIAGNTIWEFRVSAITFNTGLTDADFTLQ